MTYFYSALIGIYLTLGYLVAKNSLYYVMHSKEFTEEYNNKLDYYLDMVIFTLFWLPAVIYGITLKKIK